jgi:hypothetical protein
MQRLGGARAGGRFRTGRLHGPLKARECFFVFFSTAAIFRSAAIFWTQSEAWEIGAGRPALAPGRVPRQAARSVLCAPRSAAPEASRVPQVDALSLRGRQSVFCPQGQGTRRGARGQGGRTPERGTRHLRRHRLRPPTSGDGPHAPLRLLCCLGMHPGTQPPGGETGVSTAADRCATLAAAPRSARDADGGGRAARGGSRDGRAGPEAGGNASRGRRRAAAAHAQRENEGALARPGVARRHAGQSQHGRGGAAAL